MSENHLDKISIAPMMDWTDHHCRYFHRQLTKFSYLYTEMITPDALIHGNKERLIGYDDKQHPLCLQLGGSDPKTLAEAAQIGESFGYDEINLNIGCPSPRVQKGRFGACLMKEPNLVHKCVTALRSATKIPVTVKCRIGVDDMDDDKDLTNFITIVKSAGIDTFIIHARKAWLDGLNPKQNREVPPLNYNRVYRLKEQEPALKIIINGGIQTINDAQKHLNHVDGVMIGRAAYQRPFILSGVDQQIYDTHSPSKTRIDIAQCMIPYIQNELARGTRLHQITRHMLGLFHGEPGARSFRQILSEQALMEGAGIQVFEKALKCISNREKIVT